MNYFFLFPLLEELLRVRTKGLAPESRMGISLGQEEGGKRCVHEWGMEKGHRCGYSLCARTAPLSLDDVGNERLSRGHSGSKGKEIALSSSASLTRVILVSETYSEHSSVSPSSTAISSMSRTLSRYDTHGSPLMR